MQKGNAHVLLHKIVFAICVDLDLISELSIVNISDISRFYTKLIDRLVSPERRDPGLYMFR
uniref:Uncharacterized protein n=1 Tax=Rhizophagus irregularis (strain DAOM 181602 / DAOM 197198 / MUCL 43194) TaxID=747089 RepID=U9U5P2_RHIID